MISIHSNEDWVRPFVPRLFKLREIAPLTDTSTGTIAALNWYQNTLPSDTINCLLDRYQHVLVYCCEPFQVLSRFGEFPQVTFFSDIVIDDPLANHKYIGNWFMIHDNFYQTASWAKRVMAELRDDITTKPYRFDALLGARRPHREFIYHNWLNSQHQDKILLTYHGNDARRGLWHVPFTAKNCENVNLDDPDQLQVTLWTVMPSDELNYTVGTQNIIPTKIYNDSWFSIIPEGFINNQGTRLTEKTAKAMVSERLFVYFGAPHDLARMRRLGFETFDAVLDESYDDMEHDLERWQAAWQQVEWLCQQDPVNLLADTRDQRAHNRRVFLETDWHANLRQHIREICAKY